MTFSRRDFLKGAGALVVSFSSVPLLDPHAGALAQGPGPFDTHASHVDPRQLDSWIAIAADGTVTAKTGKCELGQGILTAQAQLVAEELGVPLDRVRVIQCDTDVCPDQGTTSGSQSTPSNFNEKNLGQAAATAREALLKLASERLGAPVDQLSVAAGVVAVKPNGAKHVSYGDLLAGKTFNLTVSSTARRRARSEWTVLGRPAPRLDMAAMATGQQEYVHTVRVPGMLHGRVVRPPTVGAAFVDVDETSVAAIPGFVKVVVRRNFVGVVAERQSAAALAAEQLKVRWSAATALPKQAEFYAQMRTMTPSRDAFVVDSKDVDKTLEKATVVKATYLHPYQAHGAMGASCAVADVRDGKATIWSPTQSAYPTRNGVAKILGLPLESVRVIYTRGSGCYGLNAADTVSFDAAILSHAVGRPVRVQLTRKDEFISENYGHPYVIDQRVGLDRDGTIVAWDYEAWLASLGNRPGYDTPGNVVTGALVGFESDRVGERRQAGDAPDRFRNGNNAAPSYVSGCVGGHCGGAGKVRSERVLTHTVNSPFFTGPLRSPSRLQNTFAHECFLDEVAARVKADPVAYRLRHLSDERLIDCVKQAAKAAGWAARPSPNPAPGAAATGRGIACVAYEGDNGYAAMIAEVGVDRATGKVRVTRFVVAHDCGPISNPDGLKNQIEGGTLQGMSRAMGEEITWDDQKVTSINWRSYHSLPLGFEVPPIETVLIDRTGVPATGAGETAITLVAAAIGNAIFDATGTRIREVPFTPERVKAAIDAKTPSPEPRAPNLNSEP